MSEIAQISSDPNVVGNYRLDKCLGQGTYGKVRLAYRLDNNEKVAVKVIEKGSVHTEKQVSRIQREIRFLKLLHHPHIVKVYDIIETPENIYFVMEYAKGGELFDYIVAHKRLKEKEARNFFRQIISAVDYCHQNSVIHRDLKPENLLLDTNKSIKIIDFGFGNTFKPDGLLDTFCGSPFYAAPEMILGKKYEGPEVDVWSLGVILFALLCGHLPFDDENVKELYRRIASANYRTPDYVTPDAKSLIVRMICVDPKKRATIEEIKNHKWVLEGYGVPPDNFLPERPILDPSKLNKDIVNRLVPFGYKFEDTMQAFSDQRPHPIKNTYYLLCEMLQREEKRRREDRRKSSFKILGSTNDSAKSASSLYCIDEDSQLKQPPATSPIQDQKSTSDQYKAFGSMPNALDQVPTSRRTSTPAGILSSFMKTTVSSARKPSAEQSENVQQQTPQFQNQQQNLHDEAQRRASMSVLNSKNSSASPTKPDDIREVHGWFFNVATTSRKNRDEIIAEILRVLPANNLTTKTSNSPNIVICIDPSADNASNQLEFEIEICKVPNLSLLGLHFRRVNGSLWQYKKICGKLLSQMSL